MRYEFIVEGSVTDSVKQQLPELAATDFPTGGTALFGTVQDEADVLTIYQRICGLGLSVVETRQLPD